MSRKGFTLVELLVTIGIIAVLAALLLPALGMAREASRKTMCANNLRTLAMGFTSYANDNGGALPGMATAPPVPWDWIYWTYWAGPPYSDFSRGPLCQYVGKNEAVFRCPSDDWTLHTIVPDSTEVPQGPYRYSYILNPMAPVERYACCISGQQCRLSSVRGPSEKILLIEGNELTMIDGVWVPPPAVGSFRNDLGDRHDRVNGQHSLGRGNVVFVDTHVEFVEPRFAHDPLHYVP